MPAGLIVVLAGEAGGRAVPDATRHDADGEDAVRARRRGTAHRADTRWLADDFGSFALELCAGGPRSGHNAGVMARSYYAGDGFFPTIGHVHDANAVRRRRSRGHGREAVNPTRARPRTCLPDRGTLRISGLAPALAAAAVSVLALLAPTASAAPAPATTTPRPIIAGGYAGSGPWAARLYSGGQETCTATIIAPTRVLTAKPGARPVNWSSPSTAESRWTP